MTMATSVAKVAAGRGQQDMLQQPAPEAASPEVHLVPEVGTGLVRTVSGPEGMVQSLANAWLRKELRKLGGADSDHDDSDAEAGAWAGVDSELCPVPASANPPAPRSVTATRFPACF